MLYFIIPLRSSHTTGNWPLTCRLLGRTLRNIGAQRSSNWRAVVVASEHPEIAELSSPKIALRLVNLPIPSTREERRHDKKKKIAAGLELAFQLAGGDTNFSIMIVDGDDLVSVHLSKFVEESGAAFGYCIDRGYLHVPGAPLSWKHNRFNRLCGSSCVINIRQSSRILFGATWEVETVLGRRHSEWSDMMIARGAPLTDIPFRGAVYSVSTGDNHSGISLGFRWKPWRATWVGQGMMAEFPGIEMQA